MDGAAFGGGLGSVMNSNAVAVKIANEGTQGANLNFTEKGRKPALFKLYELFGSSSRTNVVSALQAGQANANWTQLNGDGWTDFQEVNLSLTTDKKTLTINATDGAGHKLTGTAAVSKNGLARIVGQEGKVDLVRLFGGPEAFNLAAVKNLVPSFTKGANQTALEDASKVTVATWATNINKGAAAESDQTVSFTVTSDKPDLFEDQPSVASDGTLTFKPKANANGVATVKVAAKDDGGVFGGGDDTSDEQSFTITITAVNDVPSFTKGANQTVAEDAAAQTVNNFATNLVKGPTDEDSQTLTFNVTTTNPALFQVAPAIDPTGKLTYTVKANTTGAATVSVTIKDSGLTANGGVDTSAAQTFTITVTGSNDPPVAGNDSATVAEGSPATINVLANDSDPEGGTLTVTILDGPAATVGTAVVNTDKTITFTPANNFAGVATFTYQLSDGQGGIATGTVSVTVTNANDAPVATDDTATTTEGTQTTIDVKANDTDPDTGDTLTITATDPPNGTTSVNTTTGIVTYVPGLDFAGTDTFTYTIDDGNGGIDTGTVTVTVTAVNDAPTIEEPAIDPATEVDTDFTFTTNDGTEILIGDVDAGATNELEVTLTMVAAQGTLSLGSTTGLTLTTGDGVDDNLTVFRGTLAEIEAALEGLVYSPATGFTGTASIKIDVSDLGNTGSGGIKEATLNIPIEVTDSSGFADSVDEFMSDF